MTKIMLPEINESAYIELNVHANAFMNRVSLRMGMQGYVITITSDEEQNPMVKNRIAHAMDIFKVTPCSPEEYQFERTITFPVLTDAHNQVSLNLVQYLENCYLEYHNVSVDSGEHQLATFKISSELAEFLLDLNEKADRLVTSRIFELLKGFNISFTTIFNLKKNLEKYSSMSIIDANSSHVIFNSELTGSKPGYLDMKELTVRTPHYTFKRMASIYAGIDDDYVIRFELKTLDLDGTVIHFLVYKVDGFDMMYKLNQHTFEQIKLAFETA